MDLRVTFLPGPCGINRDGEKYLWGSTGGLGSPELQAYV